MVGTYTSYEWEILARLQVGQLLICKECEGQGYYFPASLGACPHCYGAGVMTPELRAALGQQAATSGEMPTGEMRWPDSTS